MSVDGTDCPIQVPYPFWSGWASHKFKKSGVRYEVGLSIQQGEIVWLNGPFPAGRFADVTIFRKGLKWLLLASNERAEADLGYRGEPFCVDLPEEGCFFRGEQQKKLKARVRSRHETVNSRLKNFACLSQPFKHRLSKHKYCFNAVAVITQVSIKYGGKSLFPIYNYKTQTLHQLS